MSKTDQILLKMQTAQALRWEDAQALGRASASLCFLLADLLDDLGKHAQAFQEVRAAPELRGAGVVDAG